MFLRNKEIPQSFRRAFAKSVSRLPFRKGIGLIHLKNTFSNTGFILKNRKFTLRRIICDEDYLTKRESCAAKDEFWATKDESCAAKDEFWATKDEFCAAKDEFWATKDESCAAKAAF